VTYVYLLAGGDRERELALAEALALTGGRRCAEKLVEAECGADPSKTGYLAAGMELLAHGKDLASACRALSERDVASDGFAIDVRRVPRGLKIRRREIAGALAAVLHGRPNLSRPSERFLAVATADGVWFGRALVAAEPDWHRLARKPHDCSSALPAQAARAVCNLVVRGGERVVDPCCGSGTLLLHAAALGADVTGHDLNPKMVGATNKNLEHFGLRPGASVADAAKVAGDYDVLLTNLPYGRMSATPSEKVRRIVANLPRLAPRGAVVTAEDVSADLRAAGARVRLRVSFPKFSFTRLIFVYERA